MQGQALAPDDPNLGADPLRGLIQAPTDFKIFGRLMQDFAWIDDTAFGTPDGSEARRARIGVSGTLAEGLGYKMEVDFASFGASGAAFTDAFLQFKNTPVGVVKVGHFKEPFGLNELTSSRFITFTERNDAFAIGRNSGVLASDATDEMTWQAGFFLDTAKNLDTSGNSGAVTGRFVYRPVFSDGGAELVHIGGAVSIRENESGAYAWSTSGGIHLLAGKMASATMAADDLTLVGIEGAWQSGPTHIEAEFAQAEGDDDSFTAWYLQGGYFLTGESRGYKTSSAAFDRVKPHTPWGESGNGAWELAARVNEVDLSDAVADETALQIALALNWYLTSHTRISLSLYNTESDVSGRDDAKGAVIRFGFDF